MSRGKKLEKDFFEFIKELIEASYWPSRAGQQNGYDSYARFKFGSMEYLWRFELKDLNAKSHKKDFGDIKEIEIKDFSEKILQLIARENEATFPHVFCVVIPHKRIGNNNQLRTDLLSWNHFNKFPFEILIWDFDILFPVLKKHYPNWVDVFYPNVPKNYKCADADPINEIIKRKSQSGCLYTRSYIRIRKMKESVKYPHVLHIRITEEQDNPLNPQVKVECNTVSALVDFARLSELCISKYPEPGAPQERPETKQRRTIGHIEGDTPKNITERVSVVIYDEKSHLRDIDLKKSGIVALFKDISCNGKSLFKHIKEFCSSCDKGCVSFIIDANVQLARVPFKELTAAHFGETSDITFAIEYTDNE